MKNPNSANKLNYTKQRNYCVNLLKREKKKYYSNIKLENVLDSKKFWKTIKPLFSEREKSKNKITLIEGEHIVTSDAEIAELMIFFRKQLSN